MAMSEPSHEAILIWRFGQVEVNESARELRVAGQVVETEPKPLELLLYLLQRAGEVVTREEILETLWLDRVVTDAVITSCVSKLRQAIGDEDQIFVRTVPRYGYRLVGEVVCQRVSAGDVVTNDLALCEGGAVPLRPQWTLERQLSSGAHGEVWLARHATSPAQRVFKFGRNAASLTALKREITLNRILAESLGQSPDFMPLLGWNLEEPPFFLETEFAPLGNLADWCHAQGGIHQVPLETRLELIAQCAAALAAAHSVGVLHKDLKPSNILITLDPRGQPRARLCDFAAGRVVDNHALSLMSATRLGFTQTGDAVVDSTGTPLYLAPELLAGQPPTIVSDIFSLGTLLYQMAIGDFRRVLSPGWEVEITDPLLREDIAAAAAGNPKLRLADAGQLALRLRSLESRRIEYKQQHKHLATAEQLRHEILRTQARRGLLVALCVTLLGSSLALGWLYWTSRSEPAPSPTAAACEPAPAKPQ